MLPRFGSAAIFAAFLFALPLRAEDITLLSREGHITLSGRLQGYDGEFYRIETKYGPLTVDGEGVICEGPACPDLIMPKAVLRLVGAPDAGNKLLPRLLRRFATTRGLLWQDRLPEKGQDWAGEILSADQATVLAEVSFTAMEAKAAKAALLAGDAELEISAQETSAGGARAIALDAMVPIFSPDNPTPKLSTPDLAKALSGEVKNWSDLGGPDMPIVIHALSPESDFAQALAARLGVAIKADVLHADLAALAAAVAKDPWALAITGRSGVAPAAVAPLVDSCGYPLAPESLAVKAEDYPLALPLFLLTPPRRLPLLGREFLDFLGSPAAGTEVAAAGFIDRSVESTPMTQDGLRLLNAIRGAGEDVSLADLKRLAEVMEGAERLSFTFRFDEETADLDAHSQENLAQFARLLETGAFASRNLILAGFSDRNGPAEVNKALSSDRAERVLQDLITLAPDLPEARLPRSEGFGEVLPMACDETLIGRRLNRRVELWMVPHFTPEPL